MIKLTELNLQQLAYPALATELVRINESIDWEALEKDRKDSGLVSIIVVSLDNLYLTIRCIESIIKAKTNAKFEIILLSNGSKPYISNGFKTFYQGYEHLTLIESNQNLNFALGNNIAFSKARGDICVFINNDTYVTDFWLDNLVNKLKDEKIKAVQPTLLYPDGSLQNIGIVFSEKSILGYPLYARSVVADVSLVKDRFVKAVTGACMAVRSTDFARVKGFDPIFINGQEDVDLCLRLIQKSKDVCFCTKDSVVYHDEAKTPGRGKYIVENRLAFIKRWQGKIEADDKKYFEKDGFIAKGWQPDFDEKISKELIIYRPILEKTN